jgi:type IV pilus assembly protein PilE
MTTPPLRQLAGVTLIELVIVMSLVATLAALAIPSYRFATTAARRMDARLSLLQIHVAQERHYSTHYRFASTLPAPPEKNGLGISPSSDGGDYELALATTPDGQAYTATARASSVGRQHEDLQCMTFSIDSVGRKRSTDNQGQTHNASEPCWK